MLCSIFFYVEQFCCIPAHFVSPSIPWHFVSPSLRFPSRICFGIHYYMPTYCTLVCYQVSVYAVSAFLHSVLVVYWESIHFSSPYKTIGHSITRNKCQVAKLTCFHIFGKIHTILASKYLADYHADPQVSLMKILNLKQQ